MARIIFAVLALAAACSALPLAQRCESGDAPTSSEERAFEAVYEALGSDKFAEALDRFASLPQEEQNNLVELFKATKKEDKIAFLLRVFQGAHARCQEAEDFFATLPVEVQQQLQQVQQFVQHFVEQVVQIVPALGGDIDWENVQQEDVEKFVNSLSEEQIQQLQELVQKTVADVFESLPVEVQHLLQQVGEHIQHFLEEVVKIVPALADAKPEDFEKIFGSLSEKQAQQLQELAQKSAADLYDSLPNEVKEKLERLGELAQQFQDELFKILKINPEEVNWDEVKPEDIENVFAHLSEEQANDLQGLVHQALAQLGEEFGGHHEEEGNDEHKSHAN